MIKQLRTLSREDSQGYLFFHIKEEEVMKTEE